MGLLPQPIAALPVAAFPVFLSLLLAAAPLSQANPWSVLWTVPAILLASMMIAWAAEAAQFFVAQGFALAMLAWLQTLPEFAAEADFAWRREFPLLLAGLTGALRLLTGLGWPMIYATAALAHRRRGKGAMKCIRLEGHHSVEVMGLLAPLLYFVVVGLKGSLSVWDSIPLIAVYAAYLWILGKLPPEDPETIEELEEIPRRIVLAPRTARILVIAALFVLGGAAIFVSTDPFVGSLYALSVAVGVPAFVFMQWMLPVVTEFPELASTYYFARTEGRESMALMNMVSSNINQWTLLPAMLPIVLSVSAGAITPIVFDSQQTTELWMTIGQALIGMVFLVNMELAWWEALALLALYVAPYTYRPLAVPVLYTYYIWAAVEVIRLIVGNRDPAAFREARKMLLQALRAA